MITKEEKKALNKMFWRLQLLQVSRNYERMNSLPSVYVLNPMLQLLYKDGTQEERANAMKRHLEYFNCQPTLTGMLLGVTAAMEKTTTEANKESVLALKTGLMGPMSGVGDSLFWFTIWPICASIGASIALTGNILGAALTFVLFNAINIPTKYFGLHFGYEKGVALLTGKKAAGNPLIQRITNMANVLGVTVVGTLISSIITVNVGGKFKVGDNTLVVQDMLNQIMPCLLPVLVTVICYKILKIDQGKYTVRLIFGLLILATALASFGILV